MFLDIVIALIIDYFAGDPRWLYHPVRAIGFLINKLEKLTRTYIKHQFWAGVVTTVTVILVSYVSVYLTLQIASYFGSFVYHIVNIGWIYLGLCARDLARAGEEVYDHLAEGEIDDARRSLSHLVSRDTSTLNESDISAGTIESISENTCDGVVAPLLFAALGGAPLLWAYKAVNTCDSMIGYKNEKYIKFGAFAARLDDAVNYIPARLCYLLFPLAAKLGRFSSKNAWVVGKRDAQNDDSPNSGISEACAAGALEVKLGGSAVYHGKVVEKVPFGAEFRSPNLADITRSIRLMWACVVATLPAVFILSLFLY